MAEFVYRTRIEAPAEAVFAWHERPGAFERLSPPWEEVEVRSKTGGIRDGARVELRMSIAGVPVPWVLEHRDYEFGRRFRDVQVKGPFRSWEHTHNFHPDGDDACVLEDRVRYEPPLGTLGEALSQPVMEKRLLHLFVYRHRVTKRDVEETMKRGESERMKTMKVAITGASGLIGESLSALLTTQGHEVRPMVRHREQVKDNEIYWSAQEQEVETKKLAGLDAVVHLAGESIAGARWTSEKKRRIEESRVKGTTALAEALAGLEEAERPKVFVCASAMGYYGDRGEEVLTEESPSGEGFLPEVCRKWEASADPAREAGIRVAHTRFGIVLSPKGGALKQMLLPFRLGAGGKLGSGRQWMSWVALEDVAQSIRHTIENDQISGPVNVCSPNPVRNEEFTKTLGRVLGRPTFLPAPAAGLKLLMGQMADDLLLSSTRMDPAVLDTSGFRWRYPDLEGALRDMLGKG